MSIQVNFLFSINSPPPPPPPKKKKKKKKQPSKYGLSDSEI